MWRGVRLPPVLVQFVRYALVGCVASAVDVAVYWLLGRGLAWHPLAANVLSAAVGLSVSFVLNRRLTFRVADHPGRRYAAFLAVGACGTLVQELVIWLLYDRGPLDALPAKLVALVCAGLLQFVLNRSVSFGSRLGG